MDGFIAASVLSSLGMLGVLIVAAAIALPLAWLWMLIDALARDEHDYPGGPGSNEKLLWVLLILLVHVSAIAYFFIVFRRRKRSPLPAAVAG